MRKNFNQTYLMIGMYFDFGLAMKCEEHERRQQELHKKLKIRWEKGIDRDAFEEYFKFYGIDEKALGF